MRLCRLRKAERNGVQALRQDGTEVRNSRGECRSTARAACQQVPIRVAQPQTVQGRLARTLFGLASGIHHGGRGSGNFDIQREVKIAAEAVVEVGERHNGTRQGGAGFLAMLCRKMPLLVRLSCASTGTPSAVRRTSLSSPPMPDSRAKRKAASEFSGAWAMPPRWAKSSGRLSGFGKEDTIPSGCHK